MTYIIANILVLLVVVVFQVIVLDAYIKRLVDEAIARRCSNCEFKKSEIPESQKIPGVSEF